MLDIHDLFLPNKFPVVGMRRLYILDSASSGENIFLQSSTDGGLSWILIEIFPIRFLQVRHSVVRQRPHTETLFVSKKRYVTIDLSDSSRSNATRFRWWQATLSGRFTTSWSIDHIVVAGSARELDDDFTTYVILYVRRYFQFNKTL